MPGRIVLGEDAVASIVETFAGSGWANRLTQITLGRGARLMRSVRLLQAEGFVSIRDEAEVGEAASLVSVFLGAGGAGSRIDGAITVTGKGGFAEMGGALLTRGAQKQEAAVVVRHGALDGTSRQVWRAVAADQSTASLAARVEVARAAQKTDAEQSLRGLLLERGATVNLKPELEIFADDVKCAHGATVGELDKRALFYLESRGIPRVARQGAAHACVRRRCAGADRRGGGARGVRGGCRAVAGGGAVSEATKILPERGGRPPPQAVVEGARNKRFPMRRPPSTILRMAPLPVPGRNSRPSISSPISRRSRRAGPISTPPRPRRSRVR
ncbi:MAG: SufD family Fe-S cluster assembly protein [Sphingomonas sp.]